MQVHELIDAATQRAGSQVKLAKVLGVSSGNVNDWRHARRPCPLEHVAALAEYMGADPKETVWNELRRRTGKATAATVKTVLVGVAAMLAFGANAPAQAAAGYGAADANL